MRLGTAIMQHLHVSRRALISTVSHGRVTLDGEVITIADLNKTTDEVQGSYVRLFEREFQVGSRLVEKGEQLTMGGQNATQGENE